MKLHDRILAPIHSLTGRRRAAKKKISIRRDRKEAARFAYLSPRLQDEVTRTRRRLFG